MRLVRVAASVAAAAALAAPVAASASFSSTPASFSPLTAFAAAGVTPRPAYPQQNVLPVWPDNPADASASIGDIPYDEIAPKLNALQAASNRISARVAGKSSGGRDLYAVVVTAPETAAEAAQQGAWRQLIEDEPVRAREDAALLAGYKTPLFVNGNIHGNEKEGTDAIVRVLEQYATSTDPAIEALLKRNILIFNVTSNPDGRIANTRANSAGYDLNRDLTIASQPEARLIRDLIVEHRPIITLDLHGYVNPTLLHPSTPPHNVNNEYDLYIKHGLPNALNIESGIAALGYPEVTRARIPFRDDAPGVWDDFPPIYVPSFAMLQSSIPYTIEAPLQPSGTGATAIRRADIDTDVHDVAIKTSLKYIQDHRDQVIFDQAEGYRRGWAAEPLRDIPVGYVEGWGEEDKYTTTFPRAYVIPAGARQRSAPAVKRLVDLLIASGGRVTIAKAAFTAGGNTYPAGSYVLDLRQPKRGLVNSLLEPGIDLTDRVDDLYAGPGAWSQALTWGATVDTLWDPLPAVDTERVYEGVAAGQVAAGEGDLVLDPQDAEDLLALNALLDQGVKTQRLADGSVLIPRTARALATAEATKHGTTFKAAPSAWTGASLDKVVVAYNGGSEVRDTLLALGFEGRAVTATTLTTTLTPDVDVLLVGATLNPATLNAANKAALDAFLARRGGVVGLTAAGAAFTTNAGLLTATATTGQSLVSGVANVVNHGGPVVNGAQPYAWIFPATWYSGLGANAVVEQSYAADPLLSGWWRPSNANNGQAQAAGKASVVHAIAPGGTGVVLIGTSPTVRLHAKGLQPQLGRALLWSASQTTAATAVEGTAGGSVPATLALTLGTPATFGAFTPGVAKEYTAGTTANVISTAGDAALTVADPSTTATGRLVNGAFALVTPLQASGGGAFAPLTATLKTYAAPVSNDAVTISFRQQIGANEPLRTGSYSKTLTFTLSTTTP
ncbi:M14 family zinc carboxypeptidase [Solirubrobacter ginsenosidimutans]|uniref:M14 family zinc carboxypeptidase n=1 Tax=Solirubrobacter ginsenosidimutans TaxID=490573 RepID=A0A9X3MQ56_9ACTN|nr:M14 family zinc carboxypeptidase [Solirubrobacter ginsenosidimutans]MDA0160389.1 M14 family zinc carboxypeptidase [Solirubrobacter ginsenosidimutans]